MLFDFHQKIDGIQEDAKGDANIGTTKKGIGPAYSSKTMRNGIRFGQLRDWDAFEASYRELISANQGR